MKKVYETPVLEVNSCDYISMIAESLPVVDDGTVIEDDDEILSREDKGWGNW